MRTTRPAAPPPPPPVMASHAINLLRRDILNIIDGCSTPIEVQSPSLNRHRANSLHDAIRARRAQLAAAHQLPSPDFIVDLQPNAVTLDDPADPQVVAKPVPQGQPNVRPRAPAQPTCHINNTDVANPCEKIHKYGQNHEELSLCEKLTTLICRIFL